jgi:septum formation protein
LVLEKEIRLSTPRVNSAGGTPLSPPSVERDMRRRSIVLGSSSKSRQMILTELGLEFSTVSADVDEKSIGDRSVGASPSQLVLQIARAKANHLISNNLIPLELSSSFLLTADTVAVYQQKILEKPSSEAEFVANMQSYSTAPCSLVSGVVVTDLINGEQYEGSETATLHFAPLTEEAVSGLLSEGRVFNCAGGIMVENPLMRPFISAIEGAEDAVMGLPKSLVKSLLTDRL